MCNRDSMTKNLSEPEEIETPASLVSKWPGSIKVFCCTVSAGSSWYSPALTLLVIILSYTLVGAGPVAFLRIHYEESYLLTTTGILGFITVTLFLLTALTDPGILPRCNTKKFDSFNRPPVTQRFAASGTATNLRFCDICYIYKPPFTEHCAICQNCVLGFDHHCPWIGNCIGKRTYHYFICFITSVFLSLCYVIGTAVLQIYVSAPYTDAKAVFECALTCILAFFAFVTATSIGYLLVYHIRLIIRNRTTCDQIRNAFDPIEPVGHGWRVILHNLCQSRQSSYIKKWMEEETKKQSGEEPAENETQNIYSLGTEKPQAEMVPLNSFRYGFLEPSSSKKA